MNNKPGLFMGWSGDLSKEIALSLKKIFNSIFRGSIEVFFTEEDIDPGKLWNNDLNQKLYKCDIGILVCTPQNLDSLWMAYEAGAISNRIGQGRVIPLVFGANITDLKGPLKQFQAKRFAVVRNYANFRIY